MMCDEINMWKSYWILFVFCYFKHYISAPANFWAQTYTQVAFATL